MIAAFVFLFVFYADKTLLRDAYSQVANIGYTQAGHSRDALFVDDDEIENLIADSLLGTFVISQEDLSQQKREWKAKLFGNKQKVQQERLVSLSPAPLESINPLDDEEKIEASVVALSRAVALGSMQFLGDTSSPQPAQPTKKGIDWRSFFLFSNPPTQDAKEKSVEVPDEEPMLMASNRFSYDPTPPEPEISRHGYNFFVPKRIAMSHVEGFGPIIGPGAGGGIAYGTDYTTVQVLFAPIYHPGHFVPMLDVRGHKFDNNTYASNIGIVARYIPQPNSFCDLLGLNAYWDWRQGFRGHYNQLGLGIEVLGKRWDFRANGYVPIGPKKHGKHLSIR